MNQKSRSVWLACTMLLLLGVMPTAAQLQSGNLYGVVADDQGAPLPGVTVTLSGAGTASQVTDERGRFRFPGLAPGRYGLDARLDGFSPVEYPNVTIGIGKTTELAMTMNAAVTDVITVTTESPLLDASRPSVQQNVTQTELEKIPTARDPWAILSSTPNVLSDRINVGGNESGQQSQIVGGGAHSDQAVWSVDGVVITDMAALGSSPAYYDFDAFEEMQVTTGGSDASVATGGVVLNMVTKRGTNDFRGSARYIAGCGTDQSGETKGDQCFTNMQGDLSIPASEFGRPGPWNRTSATGAFPNGRAQSAFAQGNRIQSVEDYGLELGGPILRDRFWFWGALAKNDIDLLTAAPLNVRDHTILDTQNVKLNAQLGSRNSITGSALQSDKVKIGRNAGPTRPQETTWNQSKFGADPTSWKLEDTHVFSSSLYLTGMYSIVNGGFQLAPQGGLDKLRYRDASNINRHSFLLYQTERPQEQIKLDGSTFLSTGAVNHELKFGVGTRTAETNSLSRYGNAGILIDKDLAGTSFDYVILMRDAVSNVETQYESLYLQDTLSFGNLTANVGLNYGKQTGSAAAAAARANPVLPQVLGAASFAGAELPFEWTDLSPRLGLTWALGEERTTLLRATYSQFADQLGSGGAAPLSPLYNFGYFYFYTDGGGRATGSLTPANFIDVDGDGRITANDAIFRSPVINQDGSPISGAPITEWAEGFSAPQTQELLLGVEHAFRPEFVVGANLTYRRLHDLASTEPFVLENGIERLHRREDYVAIPYQATLPDGTAVSGSRFVMRPEVSPSGRGFVHNNGFEQEYLGGALSFTKRLANRWMARGNVSFNDFTWSKVPEGERENLTQGVVVGGGVGAVREGDPVIDNVAGSGKTGGRYVNAEWSYSLNGLYQVAPDRIWGFNVAASLAGRQGYPTPYFGTFNLPVHQGGTQSVLLTGVGDRYRLDDVHTVDLRVEKEFSIRNFGVTVGVDLFNALNEGTVLFRNPNISAISTVSGRSSNAATTGDFVQEVLSPRIFRLGVRLSLR